MLEQILDKTAPYAYIKASTEGTLHFSTLSS